MFELDLLTQRDSLIRRDHINEIEFSCGWFFFSQETSFENILTLHAEGRFMILEYSHHPDYLKITEL